MANYLVYDMTQADKWRNVIEQLNVCDIFFTPEYCKIYEANGEGEAKCFVYEEEGRIVCYPFLYRKINELPLVRQSGLEEEYFDIITPYGYGGPLTNVTDLAGNGSFFRRFEQAFDSFCKESRIVSEFVRFHPLIRNHEFYQAAEPKFERQTVHIDLRKSRDDMLSSYTATNRNRIRKAIKDGLEVKRSTPDVKKFTELYYPTMKKNGANYYYYFPESFFHHTFDWLREYVTLFEVSYRGNVILSCIFLHYGPFLHYHLVGSKEEFLYLAPSNLLIDYAAEWGKENGYAYLHLGGGYSNSSEDSLYQFKKKFNSNGAGLDYYIGKKVRNDIIYQRLMEGVMTQPEQHYFPAYRQPLQHMQAESETKAEGA